MAGRGGHGEALLAAAIAAFIGAMDPDRVLFPDGAGLAADRPAGTCGRPPSRATPSTDVAPQQGWPLGRPDHLLDEIAIFLALLSISGGLGTVIVRTPLAKLALALVGSALNGRVSERAKEP